MGVELNNAPLYRYRRAWGLYAIIPLPDWRASSQPAMEEFVKPRSELLIRLHNANNNSRQIHSNATYEFLKLRPHNIWESMARFAVPTSNITTMKPETRVKLEVFYRPYNRQLEVLLGEGWHGVWEYRNKGSKRLL